jgi:hypothetical protein
MKWSLRVCESWNFKLAAVQMGRKPSAVLKLGAADAQFAAFRLPARLVDWGRRLSEKWQKYWAGTKTVA